MIPRHTKPMGPSAGASIVMQDVLEFADHHPRELVPGRHVGRVKHGAGDRTPGTPPGRPGRNWESPPYTAETWRPGLEAAVQTLRDFSSCRTSVNDYRAGLGQDASTQYLLHLHPGSWPSCCRSAGAIPSLSWTPSPTSRPIRAALAQRPLRAIASICTMHVRSRQDPFLLECSIRAIA